MKQHGGNVLAMAQGSALGFHDDEILRVSPRRVLPPGGLGEARGCFVRIASGSIEQRCDSV